MRKIDAADLSGLKPLAPRSAKIWADAASSGEPRVAAKRWIVERPFGWLGTSRRLVRDSERKVQTTDQRGAYRAGDDPPHTATVGEARLTLANKSLGR